MSFQKSVPSRQIATTMRIASHHFCTRSSASEKKMAAFIREGLAGDEPVLVMVTADKIALLRDELGAEAALEYGETFDGVRPDTVRVPLDRLESALAKALSRRTA